MRNRLAYILLLLLFAVVLSSCANSDGQLTKEDNLEGMTMPDDHDEQTVIEVKPEIGYMAPNFSFINGKGELVDINSLQGKPIFINFWASW